MPAQRSFTLHSTHVSPNLEPPRPPAATFIGNSQALSGRPQSCPLIRLFGLVRPPFFRNAGSATSAGQSHRAGVRSLQTYGRAEPDRKSLTDKALNAKGIPREKTGERAAERSRGEPVPPACWAPAEIGSVPVLLMAGRQPFILEKPHVDRGGLFSRLLAISVLTYAPISRCPNGIVLRYPSMDWGIELLLIAM